MTTSVKDRVKQFDVNKEASYLESFIKLKCRLSKKSQNVYVPICRTILDDEFWLKKVEVGRKDKSKREKVIMLVGATGSGKTTTINAMFNYIMGVEFEDKFRLQLIEEDVEDPTKSVTKCITAYTIHHQPGFKIDYAITIIDTPGFGDTSGITRDIEITEEIKTFLSTEGFEGIGIVDALGFVVPYYPPRFVLMQRYIFDSLLSVFGKDIEDNIFMFYTFAGPEKKPPGVIDAVKAAKIPHSDHFKFDHKGLYWLDCSDSEEETKSLYASWNLGRTNFQNFFTRLNLVEPKSMQMTKEILLIKTDLEYIQKHIMLGVNELEKLNTEKEVLKKYEHDMDSKKDIEYQVNEQFTEILNVPYGFTAVNCKKCNVTCLKTMYPYKNSNLEDCWLFKDMSGEADNTGCHKCPWGCQLDDHKCEEKYYVIKTKMITKTLGELQESYKDPEGSKMTAEQITKECQERIDEVGDDTVKLVEKARRRIERLDEIALKPDPLSTDDYIDLMIEAEKAEAGGGLTKRIQALMQLKERQEVRRNVATGAEKVVHDQINFVKGEEKRQRNQDGHFLGELKKIFKKKERLAWKGGTFYKFGL